MSTPPASANGFDALRAACAAVRARLAGMAGPPPPCPRLERLVAGFGLSGFERDVLLLAAGMEIDEHLAPLLAEQDPQGRGALSFALPLSALPDAHWSALSPDRPLRRWQLISLTETRPLARAAITIDERILHHLAGLDPLDTRLVPFLAPVAPAGWMPETLERLVSRAVQALAARPQPVIALDCTDVRDARALAARAAMHDQTGLWRLQAADLPVSPAERHGLAMLWRRELHLTPRALLIEGDLAGCSGLVDIPGPVFTFGNGPTGTRPRLRLRLPALCAAEQAQLWRVRLGAPGQHLNGELRAVTDHFALGFSDIDAAANHACAALADHPEQAAETLWASAKEVARPRLRDLATEIPVRADWQDLILPAREIATLHAIVAQIRRRRRVYDDWGFVPEGARGRGIGVLFSGPSGTGKTMAAELLAGALRLDLFRIDLSQVVSKYIGETEKNLAAVFDAAEDGGAVLLFDEADALFGRRSEVRDSHDRYANMEVAYLLQRMETFGGLAVMTTNCRAALDRAFTRRLRFIVEFPFPGYDERVAIWRRIFPPGAALDGVEPELLGRLGVSGGAIRNIALNAAFLAAEDGAAISMAHLNLAAEAECAKMEKKIASGETRGWA